MKEARRSFTLPIFILVGALLLLTAFLVINASKPEVARFEWTSTQSGPKAYPIELLRADLTLADGSYYYVPDKRSVYNGWGKIGATHIVGDAEKALPTRLSATWFSYVENKFYAIDTQLPVDTFRALMKQEIESPKRGNKHSFNSIVFGFGPEGLGAIWLSAHNNRIDTFRFKGAETQVEWTELVDNPTLSRAEFIDLILEEALGQEAAQEARNTGYKAGTWPRRQQRWSWDLTVTGAKEISLLQFSSLNGEAFHFFNDMEPNFKHPQYGAPEEILVHWQDVSGQARSVTLKFDERETLEIFEEFSATDDPMTLHIELRKDVNTVAVFLETSDMIYEFKQVRSEIFSRE